MRLYSMLTVATLLAIGTSVAVGGNSQNEILKVTKVANAGFPDATRVLTPDEATEQRVLRTVDDDNEDERVLGIPTFLTIAETAKKIPSASTIAAVAKKLPGASVVEDLTQKLQYQYWLKTNKSPDEVKTFLQLDDLGAKILDSPKLDILIRYTRMYNDQKSLPQTTMIAELLKTIPVDRMVELAKKIPGSEKMIENVQYQLWLKANKSPTEVKSLLGLDNLGVKILDHPKLNIWVRYQRMYNQNHGIVNAA
ncbi:putative secreted RxLR effector protein [Phytophthora cinnamomi]|uniref:putative secreted RxLR effector protein n=1 Tax=Phytophthora cinnamomi TaxID=4785 RepID=UPI00355A03E3|nr:putative secreted RxLR effector protein [Phytophthora cinnamomi]